MLSKLLSDARLDSVHVAVCRQLFLIVHVSELYTAVMRLSMQINENRLGDLCPAAMLEQRHWRSWKGWIWRRGSGVVAITIVRVLMLLSTACASVGCAMCTTVSETLVNGGALGGGQESLILYPSNCITRQPI